MIPLSRRALLIGAAALGLAPAARAFAAKADTRGPEAVVADFHAALLEVMKAADELGVKGRYGRLDPALVRAFNAAAMTQIVSGRYWRGADAAAQARAAEAFHRFSTATYAVQFSGFSGQAFETVASKPGPQDTMLVVTRIAKGGATEADLTYVLKRASADGGGVEPPWRIIDVLLDNSISQLAVRRSEYRQTLKKGGLDALATELNAAADRLLAG